MRFFLGLASLTFFVAACGSNSTVPPKGGPEVAPKPRLVVPAWKKITTFSASITDVQVTWNAKTAEGEVALSYVDPDEILKATDVMPWPKSRRLKGDVGKNGRGELRQEKSPVKAAMQCEADCASGKVILALHRPESIEVAVVSFRKRVVPFGGTKRTFAELGTLAFVNDAIAAVNKVGAPTCELHTAHVDEGGQFFRVVMRLPNLRLRKADPDYFDEKFYVFFGRVGQDETVTMNMQMLIGSTWIASFNERAQANIAYDPISPRLEIGFLNPKDPKKKHESHSFVFGPFLVK